MAALALAGARRAGGAEGWWRSTFVAGALGRPRASVAAPGGCGGAAGPRGPDLGVGGPTGYELQEMREGSAGLQW